MSYWSYGILDYGYHLNDLLHILNILTLNTCLSKTSNTLFVGHGFIHQQVGLTQYALEL